jgi:hypothetical protein
MIELSNIKYGKSKTKDGYNQREKSIGSFRKIKKSQIKVCIASRLLNFLQDMQYGILKEKKEKEKEEEKMQENNSNELNETKLTCR